MGAEKGEDGFDWGQFGLSNTPTKTPDMAKNMAMLEASLDYFLLSSNDGNFRTR